MKLFKIRKRSSLIEDAFTHKVSLFMESKQRKIAAYLERKTQYWNRSSKIIALSLFCLVFGGLCLLMLIKAIIHF